MHQCLYNFKICSPIRVKTNSPLNQVHFPHQTNTHHIKRCAAKVHRKTHNSNASTIVKNLTSNLTEKLF